jgi:hypothetical protein
MSYYSRAFQFDVVSSTYSAEFAARLHEKQLTAVFYSILARREKKKEAKRKQQFYKGTQLSLFV